MPTKKRIKKETANKSTAKKNQKNKKSPNELRSIWKGYITFGLVNIPVTLYSAEQSHQEVRFKLLDKKDLSGIRYTRVNENTGKEVLWDDIVKGYEYEPDAYVIITEEDFDTISQENIKSIEIEDFVDISE